MISINKFSARRVWTFLTERFPLFPVQFVVGLQVWFGLTYLTLGAGREVSRLSIVGRVFTIPLLLLLIRIADEFKDFAADKTHFPDRPLARGAVSLADLSVFSKCLCVAILALGMFDFRNPWMWIFLILALIFVGLMRVWFFCETTIKNSLPLALITHNPVSIFLGLYQVSIFGSPMTWPAQAFLYIGGNSLFALAWEIGRKVRRPGDETTYVTYSKIWGTKTAAMTALSLMWVGFILLVLAGPPIQWHFLAVPLLGLCIGSALGLRFIVATDKYKFGDRVVELAMVSSLVYFVITVVSAYR